ncbi:DUF2536 family protein [Salsuginibacillus kocurii]|uniref:DUF2536 family protein n=1 Tax=Salsuginibacillus kocurii TaxID=427078 RepID=UPI00036FD5E8|nr:DUF2536 family protein [Salsuginibacillus kocurii]
MELKIEQLRDKVEFFEAKSLQELESAIQQKIETNEQIMLEVHHVQHNVYSDPKTSRPVYTAHVHFKLRAIT